MTFGSRSVGAHLVRGAIGIGALIAAMTMRETWSAIVLVVIALIALRGCPMCWTLGLVETVIARVRGRRVEDACVSGACALRRGRAP
ncbi:hypothetical protein [Sandaracinus amylolyticus]|uniref:hypothetical protein n=1 Tax=Sandaracinus amylolyticus TaxID=927083 RepID=UPI001F3DC3B6|nr:hypothetical protein [Sandaracinus amylolyticus]UJR82161.1 Hypothetical protein I5071_42260 [Sandaracinus amylolyticus]